MKWFKVLFAVATIPIDIFINPGGKIVQAPISIPIDKISMAVSIDATSDIDPSIIATIGLEISYDNGNSWNFLTSSTRPGGSAFGDHGVLVNTFSINMNLEQSSNALRQLRFFTNVAGGSFASNGGSLNFQ